MRQKVSHDVARSRGWDDQPITRHNAPGPVRRGYLRQSLAGRSSVCSRRIITGRLPRSGKLPVLNLLKGQQSGFSPRRGDSLHRFMSSLAGPTGTWVRLAVQNFTSIAIGEWECGPKNIKKKFHFLIKSRPAGATPLTDFEYT